MKAWDLIEDWTYLHDVCARRVIFEGVLYRWGLKPKNMLQRFTGDDSKTLKTTIIAA